MKRFTFLTLLLALVLGLAAASPALAETVEYGPVSLTSSGATMANHFNEKWDVTALDLAVTFTVDLTGIQDLDPNGDNLDGGDHAWAEFGVRSCGYLDFNPVGNTGVWLATDYDEPWGWGAQYQTFLPDPPAAPTLDMDDKLILQRVAGQGEGAYDLPSVPPSPGNNHRVWWDRDGVDPYQNDATANTGGIYQVVMTLHATSATTGTAFMNIRGLDQGFETDGNWNTIELIPAGMTFAGNMKAMQVFYGLYGYGAMHAVTFSDISVSGVRGDETPPTVTASIDPVAVNQAATLSASADDSGSGGSNIEWITYSIDGGASTTMVADDGGYDEVVETASVTLGPYLEPGVHEVLVTGKDASCNPSTETVYLVVYDPSAGFVTGGGWIDSPAGAATGYPDALGKASFGFVSKYLKGAVVPTGSTEFQFKAGDLNFHSDTYDWLVVTRASYRAQYKGSGTVNGAFACTGEPYKFMLWATDGTALGTADTFRIKIWWEDADGEHVVYDNGTEQSIAGGSVVVHVGKK